MIPKIIHWCWFGRGKVPRTARRCIRSWKKYLPDYTIKLWNEDNFDVTSCQYVKEAYEKRKFAFVTDYVRLYALYTEGGLYMDSDVEVLRQLERFLELPAFSGFESENPKSCLTGIMGSEKGGKWVKELLDEYDDRSFIRPDGSLDTTTNVEYTAQLLAEKGIRLDGREVHLPGYLSLYPRDYFCPKSWDTGEYNITGNTYTIHHFAASWWTPRQRAIRWTNNHLGEKCGYYVAFFWQPLPVVLMRLYKALIRRLKRVVGR